MEYASEIKELLNLQDSDNLQAVQGAPISLPTAPDPDQEFVPHAIHPPEGAEFDTSSLPVEPKRYRLKNFIIYPAVFFGAFLFFYVVLNFTSMLSQVQGLFTKPQIEVQLGSELTEYTTWIRGYYFGVSDAKVLDPNNDIDHDGLSSMDEFIVRTNPIVADSDRDGYKDGLEIMTFHNPWGSGDITDAQKKLAEGLDLTLINNRIAYNAIEGSISGAVTQNYDLEKTGRLSIPRLNIQAPLIWSKDVGSFETDLTKGVIHYPGTSLPGQMGVVYVSGHSSDYIWKKDPFATVFAKLNYLEEGDDVFVEVYTIDGKTETFRYQVKSTTTYKPDDQEQFIDNSNRYLNLSTCWPVGSTKSRLVVSAVQVGL